MSTKTLLSGNEAVARGAWEAGVEVASAYPGTPSTEIMETFARFPDVYAEWATNEKVAMDVAIGAAYAGQRAMTCMKHVGLNVAADAFFYASMTGAEAGLLFVSADDPEMHSSQNEQDNRRFAKFARVPCLEPSDSQDAKDMVGVALDLSEQFDTPVLLRLTTRISHTETLVDLGERTTRPRSIEKYPRNPTKYVMVPGNARRRHPVIEARIESLSWFAETFPINRIEWGDLSLGIITCGITYQYVKEVFPNASVLRLGMTYPLPRQLLLDFAAQVEKVVVIEELDPFLEEELRLMGIDVFSGPAPYTGGKSIFPITGELDPGIIRASAVSAGLLEQPSKTDAIAPALKLDKLPTRPPVLCPGCPHRGVFVVLGRSRLPVQGDIGCYTLGLLPPLSSIHTCGCMGAGIGVAHGADVAGDEERHIAVIGDSTFFHTGMPALLNTVYNQGKSITVIMDNRITAMTGHQDNPSTGRTLQGKNTVEIDFEPLVRAMGIEQVKVVDAYDMLGVRKAFRECRNFDGPSVLITKRECALLPEVRKQWLPLRIDPEKCVACWTCIRTGCPALLKSDEIYETNNREKAAIDPLLCTGCEVCAQLCPEQAILFRAQVEEEIDAA